jgi:hypothetical protein
MNRIKLIFIFVFISTMAVFGQCDYDKIRTVRNLPAYSSSLKDSFYVSDNDLIIHACGETTKYYRNGMLRLEFSGNSLLVSDLKNAVPSLVEFYFYTLKNIKEDTSLVFAKLKIFEGSTIYCIPRFLKKSPNLIMIVFIKLSLKNEEQITNIAPSTQCIIISNLILPRRTKVIPKYLFQLPNLQDLSIYNSNVKNLPNVKIDSSQIKYLQIPDIDISNKENMKFISQFKHLTLLNISYSGDIDKADLSPLSFVEKIYINNITDKEKEVLKKKFKNVF